MAPVSPQMPAGPAKTSLLGKSKQELQSFLAAMGEPAYRAAQLYHGLYAERRSDFATMSNLPAALRQRLARECSITVPQILREYAAADGTIRYVLQFAPLPKSAAAEPRAQAAVVETVFMPEDRRQTICISTQAGCAVGCQFCLTATLGLLSNLSAGDMVAQVLLALEQNKHNPKPQTNVVLMGQGEPLLNYEPVMDALRLLLDPQALALSPKHVTLSTSGIVPGIDRLAREPVRPKLAISLNASTDAQRDRIMPVNRKYPLAALLQACRRYPLRSWEKLTFEYVLLGGVNDSPEDAGRVVKLLANLRAKMNLIPWNPGDLPFHAPAAERVEEFRRLLERKGLPVFVRYSRGQEVMAACGQLALIESSSALTAPAP